MGTPSTCSGRAGVWERCCPHPPCLSQQWCLAFQADPTSSRGIPGHASPQSCPFYCICMANCVSLPRSVLPTPRFSPLTLPRVPSVDSCPRQGCPELIPKEVLGWAVQAKMTLARGAGGPALVGAPPNAHRGRRSGWGRGL